MEIFEVNLNNDFFKDFLKRSYHYVFYLLKKDICHCWKALCIWIDNSYLISNTKLIIKNQNILTNHMTSLRDACLESLWFTVNHLIKECKHAHH